MFNTIPGALAHAAAAFPTREAVVDGDVRIDYAALHARALRWAKALIANGTQAGDRVAIWAPNSVEWIVACFGVYAAGAVLVPFNTRYRGDEAGHILRTSAATTLLTVTDFLGSSYVEQLDDVPGLDALATIVVLSGEVPTDGVAPVVGLDAFLAGGDGTSDAAVEQRIAALTADTMSDIIFTSGTTGAPKGAMLGHGASIRTYQAWSELVDLRAGDRYLIVYPFFHTAGLKSAMLACVVQGATMYPLAVFDVPVVLDLVQRERITMLPGAPTVFQSILNHPELASFDLSSVRSSVTGAAVVPVEVVRQMREVLGIGTVVTGYGMTETTGTISMCRHDDPPEVIATTVGKPIPGMEVRIVDDDGVDVAPGTAGELIVRGFNVMQGYFANPAATADAIRDGWLSTGDIGLIDTDGNIHITDRKKDMFIVGGFNAYPAEIEAVLLTHPDIAQVAVVGVPDDRMGEVGVAFVVARTGASIDERAVLAWAWERLAKFKLAAVRVVTDLPLTPSGKVQKFLLRDGYTS
jgi:acyl-CoA synthetase (AMP-forming)/AMP-acid ligase II